jgi:hypothetical protein
MSVHCGQEVGSVKAEAESVSNRRLVRHNSESAWKLIKNNAANNKHMKATSAIFIRYAGSTRIHSEWRKQFPVTAEDWRKLNQQRLTAASFSSNFAPTSDQTEFLAEPVG